MTAEQTGPSGGRPHDYEREQRRAWVRRIAAIPLLLTMPIFALLDVNAFAALLVGVSLTAMGGILLGPDLANWFGGALGGLFWPDRSGPRKPAYGVPLSHMAAHQFDEARQAYEQIIREYPDEVKPHVELVKMAFLKLKDAALAKEFHDRAMKKLGAAGRGQVAAVYEMLSAEFKTPKHDKRVLSLHHDDGKAEG